MEYTLILMIFVYSTIVLKALWVRRVVKGMTLKGWKRIQIFHLIWEI